MKKNKREGICAVLTGGMMLSTLLIGGVLAASRVEAEGDSATDEIQITVPTACTMTGTVNTAHTATMQAGTYSGTSGIGKTTLTAYCNDYNGFSIYAVGFTGDTYGANTLVGANTHETINTGIYASGATTSSWSMKVNKVTDSSQSYNPQNMTIMNSFDNWHLVPNEYVQVAQYKASTGSSATDMGTGALGAKVETTYDAYVAVDQAADSYEGKVKYIMVHPYNEEPLGPQPATSGCINYFANASNAVGTMGCQDTREIDWSSCNTYTDYSTICVVDGDVIDVHTLPRSDSYKTTQTLLASNYSRDGYGFAGWSDSYDYATNPNAKFYGPQETVTFSEDAVTNGLSVYAVWIKSQGSIQDQSKVASVCSSLTTAPTDGTANLTSVSALTDQRDNNTYAIAKLADGKCWMIENLRLESTAEHNSDGALAQGYGTSATYGNFGGLAGAENANFENSTTANSLYYSGTQSGTASINIGTTDYPGRRMPRYNNLNTSTRASNPTSNTFPNDNTTGGMYSYGNYYTWHAAIADLTYNGTDNQSTTGTSLCPAGWHLPKGGNKSNEANNELWSLVVDGINGGTKPANYDSQTYPYYTGTPEGSDASNKLRAYPNNFLYSGYIYASSARDRGSYGYYWSSTASDKSDSYDLPLYSSSVYPGTIVSNKSNGQSIRCTVGS